jgi:hypothetical protein
MQRRPVDRVYLEWLIRIFPGTFLNESKGGKRIVCFIGYRAAA